MSAASARIETVEERGSHRLVRCGHGFAVVESRNGRIYDAHRQRRADYDDTSQGIAAAVGNGWTDETTARRFFAELTGHGEELAQRLW